MSATTLMDKGPPFTSVLPCTYATSIPRVTACPPTPPPSPRHQAPEPAVRSPGPPPLAVAAVAAVQFPGPPPGQCSLCPWTQAPPLAAAAVADDPALHLWCGAACLTCTWRGRGGGGGAGLACSSTGRRGRGKVAEGRGGAGEGWVSRNSSRSSGSVGHGLLDSSSSPGGGRPPLLLLPLRRPQPAAGHGWRVQGGGIMLLLLVAVAPHPVAVAAV